MPQRAAGWVRLGGRGATALSGAGYLALILTFRERISFPCVAESLFCHICRWASFSSLQALEPRGEEMAAGRFWDCRSGKSDWLPSPRPLLNSAAIGLYVTAFRLRRLVCGHQRTRRCFLRIALSGISMFCLQKSLATFVGHTGRPIIPLFGPLLNFRRAARYTSIGVFGVLCAALHPDTRRRRRHVRTCRSSRFATWITGGTQAELVSAPSPPGTMAKAFTDALIIVAGAGLITLVASRIRRVTKSKAGSHIAVCLAALSPIIWTYPVVISSRVKRPIRLSIAVVGLTAYALLQLAAARWAHAGAARRMLRLGQATTAAATGALGLPTQEPHRRLFLPAQILSSTAAWLASAAFLNALYFSRQRLSAAPALVWTLLAGVAQLGTLILRSFELRPRVREGDLSTTLEDLRHDAT